ncbi:MAG: hypothetical protein NVSMB6_23940 [Burkholderiaceae bacterium]
MTKLTLRLFLAYALLCPIPGHAQVSSVVAIEQEPFHRVVFENPQVRIYHAQIPPGDTTLFHLHEVDNVVATINSGKGIVESLGKPPVEFAPVAGAVSFSKAPYTHRIKNAGLSPLHFVAVEVKATASDGGIVSNFDALPGHKVMLENERVKVYRVSLDPGQATGTRARNKPWVSIALVQTIAAIQNGGPTQPPIDLNPGDLQWHESMTAGSIQNVGTAKYEAIEIELK